MSVIIRLQNLPWSANALDIRGFFRGLSIPEGGVHIVGGENGDAFIAFSTDEDARQAMMLDRGKISEVQIRLLLSSRAEMQKVIETARQTSLSMQLQLNSACTQSLTNQIPQPPIITANSFQNIANQSSSGISERQYSSSRDGNSEKDNRAKTRDRSRDRRRSHSRERERRRSRSRDRSRRRRSRSRSRDRKSYRSTRRSKSRDRSRERSRDRSHSKPNIRDKEDISIKELDKDNRFNKNNNMNNVGSVNMPIPQQPRIWDTPTPFTPNFNAYVETGNAQIASSIPIPTKPDSYGNSYLSQAKLIQQVSQPPSQNVPGGNIMIQQPYALTKELSVNSSPIANINKSSGTLGLYTAHTQSNSNLSFFNKTAEIKAINPLQNPYNMSQQSQLPTVSNSLTTIEDNMKPSAGVGHALNANISQTVSSIDSKALNAEDETDLSCLKISNMCPSTSYSDIRKFFSGLYIPTNGIKMINDKHGLRIGSAYIRFVRSTSVQKALVRNGTNLKTKKVLITPVTDEEFEAAIDSYRPQRNFRQSDNLESTGLKIDKVSLTQNLKEDGIQSPEVSTPYSVVLLENLPPFAKEQDIMKMFTSFTIVDIMLTRRKDAMKKEYDYIAYVKFHRTEDAKAVYDQRERFSIGHQPITVKPSDEQELETAREEKNQTEERSRILNEEKQRIRMMEIENDRQRENDSSEFTQYDQSICLNNNFNEQGPQKQPQENRHFESLVNPGITNTIPAAIPSIFELNSEAPVDPRRKPHSQDFSNRYPCNNMNIKDNQSLTNYIFIKNCPYKCTIQEIGDHFVSHNFMPKMIEILRNQRNMPCGECIVEFNTYDEVKQALNINNSILNGRNLRIELINPNDAHKKLGKSFANLDNNPNFNSNMMGHPKIPLQGSILRNEQFNSSHNFKPRPFGNNFYENNMGNTNHQLMPQNFRRNGQRSRFTNNSEQFGNFNLHQNDRNDSFEEPPEATIPDKFKQPGCVISMENVPYKASTDNILEFFNGFNIRAIDVIRRFNDDGTPTGDVRIAVSSPMEARAVIEAKSRQKMFNRIIYLTIL